MSKITSWDKRVRIEHDGYVAAVHPLADGYPDARLVLWPEGAPDPSTVPHAGEKVRAVGHHTPFDAVVSTGIPEFEADEWQLAVAKVPGDTYLTPLHEITRITDSPTIEVDGEHAIVSGRRHRISDVIARCAELEEL